MGRPLRRLRRLEHAGGGGPGRGARRRGRWAPPRTRRPGGGDPARRAPVLGHRRTGPGARRRPRPRLGGADRRRPRDRQIDPAPPGRRPRRPVRRERDLRLRGGVRRADPPARAPPRPRRRARGVGRLHLRRRRSRDGRRPRRGAGPGHRFDPDHVRRRPRIGAGHGGAGARQRAGAHPRGEAARDGAAARGPRHQGRPDRRPPGAGAHGRRGALFRGRARASVPHPARGEEPIRRHRRDRRVRHDRARAGGGRQPLRPVPRRARAAGERRGGVRRRRGHPSGAGRDRGPGRPVATDHPPTRRGGLGLGAPRHGPRRAGGALRPCPRRQRGVSQRRGGAAHRRTPPPTSRSPRRWSPRWWTRRFRTAR